MPITVRVVIGIDPDIDTNVVDPVCFLDHRSPTDLEMSRLMEIIRIYIRIEASHTRQRDAGPVVYGVSIAQIHRLLFYGPSESIR
jgi:hypothetical protein